MMSDPFAEPEIDPETSPGKSFDSVAEFTKITEALIPLGPKFKVVGLGSRVTAEEYLTVDEYLNRTFGRLNADDIYSMIRSTPVHDFIDMVKVYKICAFFCASFKDGLLYFNYFDGFDARIRAFLVILGVSAIKRMIDFLRGAQPIMDQIFGYGCSNGCTDYIVDMYKKASLSL